MAVYAISDLHGCKDEFDEMLKKISFSEYDEMYIIGDVCDRGNHSIALLQEIMAHPNMHLIFGNHDEWLADFAQTLIDVKKNDGVMDLFNMDLVRWLHYNGGYKTADEFLDLDYPDCYDIKLYLENREYYKKLTVKGKNFLLVHAGLGAYCRPDVRISEIPTSELVWSHIGVNDNPFDDVVMIVGHMPTFLYGFWYENRILHGKNILHIDCGCVFGRSLACVRLDDMQEFYVPSTYPYITVRS
ncbi:MAG: fructose-bisphosphatase class III [Solobacterium sp.]|nr:fructose-bisphosphatase class III [Solobacterium sp.]